MGVRKSLYLTDYVANQYPIEVLKKMIFAVVDAVDNFILEIGEENYINSSSISKYEQRLGSFQRIASSKVESMCLSRIHEDEKKKSFILKYGLALKQLNVMEKEVFVATFVNGESNNAIKQSLGLGSDQLTTIRKSAIIRFSLKMGLTKFIPLFE